MSNGKNDNDSTRNETNNEETIDKEKLLKELDVLYISLDTIYVVLLAVVMNIYYINNEIIKKLDTLNQTNNAKNYLDATHFPRITNLMYIYAVGIFFGINLEEYESKINTNDEVSDKEKIKAYKSFISTLLVFIATLITSSNLEV